MRKFARRLFPGLLPKVSDVAEGKFVEEDPPRAYSEFPFDLDQEIRGAITIGARNMRPRANTARSICGAAAPSRSRGRSGERGGLACAISTAAIHASTPTIPRSAICRRSRGSPVRNGKSMPAMPTTSSTPPMAAAAITASCTSMRRSNATEQSAPAQADQCLLPYVRRRALRAARRASGYHLDAARQALVTPIAASHYAAIADGFFSTQITTLGELTWMVQNRGALQTLRFDDVADLSVDFTRSVGVIGQQRKGNSLYVALDEALRRGHRRARARTPAKPGTPAPYLVDGRWAFRDMRRRDCGFSVMAQRLRHRPDELGRAQPGSYQITVRQIPKTNPGTRSRTSATTASWR